MAYINGREILFSPNMAVTLEKKYSLKMEGATVSGETLVLSFAQTTTEENPVSGETLNITT